MKSTALHNKPVPVIDCRGPKPVFASKDTGVTEDEIAEYSRECEEGAAKDAQAEREEWQRKGYTVWLSEPEWGPIPLSWMEELVRPIMTLDRDRIFESLESAVPLQARSIVLVLRLSGGELRVRIETTAVHWLENEGDRWSEQMDLVVLTAIVGDQVYHGKAVSSSANEVHWSTVALRGSVPPEVMDQVVSALSIPIDPWPASLYAALASRGRCSLCNRKLTDPVSKVLQIGPDCAKSLGIEHSERMVEEVLKRRGAP